MANPSLKTAKRIAALVLFVVAAATLSVGLHAQGLVTEKLTALNIVMPGTSRLDEAYDNGMLTQEDRGVLNRYEAQPMTNGLQAKVYAEHFLDAQMEFAAYQLGVAEENANAAGLAMLETRHMEALRAELRMLPENAGSSESRLELVLQREIANPASQFENARQALALRNLRLDTFLSGTTLQGFLLNAYGWWVVGGIAVLIGIVSLLAGVACSIWSFLPIGWERRRVRGRAGRPLLL